MEVWVLVSGLILLVSSSAVKVKLGHIGAVGAMKNADRILDISRRELIKEGILGDDFDVE